MKCSTRSKPTSTAGWRGPKSRCPTAKGTRASPAPATPATSGVMRRCIRSQTQHERSSKTQQAIRVLNLARFRSGIEAGISYLKRCFGIGRCNWRGSTASRPTCTLRYSPTTSCASCGCAPPDGIDPNRPPRFPRLGSGGSKPNQITESALTTCFRYDLRRRAQVVRVPRDKAIKSSSIVQTIVPTRRPFLRPSTAHSRISGVPDRRDG